MEREQNKLTLYDAASGSLRERLDQASDAGLNPMGEKTEGEQAEVVWREVSHWDDLEGYHYGIEFIQISEENDWNLSKMINHSPSPHLEELLCSNEFPEAREN